MSDIPISITFGSQGVLPRAPADIRASLLARVGAVVPGYTATLPGALITDISETDVAAIAQCDSAWIEFLNSLTPFSANPYLLNQMGQTYGVPIGQGTTTSVYVVFSAPAAIGWLVPAGFIVSDGTYQYRLKSGGIIGAGGSTLPLYAVATIQGSWAVPAGSVNQLATSVPAGYSVTVTNPQQGTPGGDTQSTSEYRTQVLIAARASAQGMASYLKSLLVQVPGVQPRLVSVIQNGANWEVICGSGDQYQVGYAIYRALFNLGTLVGSTIRVTGVSIANPAVVTTDLNHGYATGQSVTITGVLGATIVNGTNVATVTGPKTFSLPVNNTNAYTSGGIVTPNFRNLTPTLNDYPNQYTVPFVNPPQQTVAINLTWNTNSLNFVSAASVAQLGAPALADYVNSIYAGQPMNLFELQATFQNAISDILPPQLLTRMVFSVAINGVTVAPTAGTGIIAGDPESYFFTTSAQITILQG